MTTVVYGAGAVGAFFGGLLVRAGRDVAFVARGANLEAIRTRGIRIDSRLLGTVSIPPVRAASTAAVAGPASLVLVCVKAHQTPGILDDLAAAVSPETIIVPLQNGVESDEILAARFGQSRVAAAVVFLGATLVEPGIVTHVTSGAIVLGARPGFAPARLEEARAALTAEGSSVSVAKDIQYDRWRKLLWNAAFNTVSAAADLTPAEILARPDTRARAIGIMREVVAVANAHGIALRTADADNQVRWTEGASSIVTSMLIDRRQGRSMEIDDLIGVIVRKGREAGVATPLSEQMVEELKALETRG